MTRVAIQGILGSYSEEAVRCLLGSGVSILECGDFAETFDAVRIGNADNAVVPVENKIVGTVVQPAELLQSGEFRILGKLRLVIRHVLAGTPDSTIDGLTSVRSHVEALKQCHRFFTRNSHLTQLTGGDTASSIKRIVDDADPSNGAIGSRRAAEIYGAKILCDDLADATENWTTFYLIGN